MVATASWCSRALSRESYDLALNLGVCGSFDPAFQPGTVVHVMSDVLAELGAEDGDRFLSVDELGLGGGPDNPHGSGLMVNSEPPPFAVLRALPSVAAITVNTVHGDEASIAETVARLNPQVESMEGAGFMHACLIHHTPFAQIRGVSNMVERRNREAWKMPLAVQRVCNTALDLLDEA